MKYQTIYIIMASGFAHSEEIDATEGQLSKGSPKGISPQLRSMLGEMDLEWMHNRHGAYLLVDHHDEPILGWNEKTNELQKFHGFRDEIQQQTYGKEKKRLLDQVIRILTPKKKKE